MIKVTQDYESLRRSQLPSGEFKGYVSSDLNLQYDVCLTVHHFPPRLLLYWLGFDDKAIMDVLSKGLRFLLNLRACYR